MPQHSKARIGLNKIGIVDFDFSKLAKLSAYTFWDDVNSLVFPSPGLWFFLYSISKENVNMYCACAEIILQRYCEIAVGPCL
ncbi:hypothetical protein ANCCAN_03926 [Ancylostoma caninum]|uniref:Uncharacterized protein n=1 Tax=Ancylostoma caninum TaxID=29170 RepID=A0A368GZU6_ANCCA|nr:hypothetical protein ANCCAN_03926 [Ancylostoma caninum]